MGSSAAVIGISAHGSPEVCASAAATPATRSRHRCLMLEPEASRATVRPERRSPVPAGRTGRRVTSIAVQRLPLAVTVASRSGRPSTGTDVATNAGRPRASFASTTASVPAIAMPERRREFEGVRQDEVGEWHKLGGERRAHSVVGEEAKIRIAHHWIAGKDEARVRGLGLPHKPRHRRRGLGPAHEAGQDHRRPFVNPALDEARKNLSDEVGLEQATAHRRIVGMVRKQRCRHFEHFDAAGAHRIGSGGVADMAPRGLALDRDDERQGPLGPRLARTDHSGVSRRRAQSSVRPLASRASASFRHLSGNSGSAAKAASAARSSRSR